MAKSKSPRARPWLNSRKSGTTNRSSPPRVFLATPACSRMATDTQRWCVQAYSRILAQFRAFIRLMKQYDVVIVGGGIHGAGVLQAAAAAGHSAMLIERLGLASGTSSRSSKLIHGGLRYLESGQFALVRESLRERAINLRIAADLVELKPFFIPVYRDTRRRPWQLKLGLWMYVVLGGFDASTRFGTVPKREWSSLDGIETQGLEA